MRQSQGKCIHCRVRWTWWGAPLVRNALCPACHRPLERTSQNLLFPTFGAYATRGIASGRKYLTADPTELSKLRRARRQDKP